MECLEDNRGFGEALNLPAATSRLSFTMKSPIMSSSMSERSSGPEQDKLLSSPLLLSSSSSASSSSASLITYKKHHMELYICDIKTPPPPQESSEYCEAHAGLMGVTWSREQTWIFQLHGCFPTCEGFFLPVRDERGEREVGLWCLTSLLSVIWPGRPAARANIWQKRKI